jgi:alkyl hydroperoxide reductase subunit AhpC
MLGTVSRAQFLIDSNGVIRYRKVEPTSITRRTSEELLETARSLRALKLI